MESTGAHLSFSRTASIIGGMEEKLDKIIELLQAIEKRLTTIGATGKATRSAPVNQYRIPPGSPSDHRGPRERSIMRG